MTCEVCGKGITATANNATRKRYCSERCRERVRTQTRRRAPLTCPVCLVKFQRSSYTLDHIIPLAAGGAHTYANVQLAHFLCNSRKSDGDAQLRWDVMVA